MVEGYINIGQSSLLTDEQKSLVFVKLRNRINAAGMLQVRSQVHRTQLSNKADVVRKMNDLLQQALKKEKKRVATKPSNSSKVKRLDSKKKASENKQHRRKVRHNDF